MKKAFYAIPIILIVIFIHMSFMRIHVYDPVNEMGVGNATIQFWPQCNSNMLRMDWSTCNGRYSRVQDVTTNDNGVATVFFPVGKQSLFTMRFTVEKSNHNVNPTYGFDLESVLTRFRRVELIPKESEFGTEEQVIRFVESTPEFIQLRQDIESDGFELNINPQNRTYYGLWRIVYSKSKEDRHYDSVYACVDPSTGSYKIYPGRHSSNDGIERGYRCENFS